jgi:hypothetical protein
LIDEVVTEGALGEALGESEPPPQATTTTENGKGVVAHDMSGAWSSRRWRANPTPTT